MQIPPLDVEPQVPHSMGAGHRCGAFRGDVKIVVLGLCVLGGRAGVCQRLLGGQAISESPKHLKQAHRPVARQARLEPEPVLQSFSRGSLELQGSRLGRLQLLGVCTLGGSPSPPHYNPNRLGSRSVAGNGIVAA